MSLFFLILLLFFGFIENVQFNEISIKDFPWQCSIHCKIYPGKAKLCSGVLISNKWVITSASCIDGIPIDNITIGLGSSNIFSPKEKRGVLHVKKHENYLPKGKRIPINDIAVIEMDETVNENEEIKPILLPGRDQMDLSFYGVIGNCSGWGLIESNVEKNLTFHELTVIKNHDKDAPQHLNCEKQYNDDIRKTSLCTRVVNGGNICDSDIGSGLVIKDPEGWKLIGIASFSSNCESISPAAFSRITEYLDWITTNTKDKV